MFLFLGLLLRHFAQSQCSDSGSNLRFAADSADPALVLTPDGSAGVGMAAGEGPAARLHVTGDVLVTEQTGSRDNGMLLAYNVSTAEADITASSIHLGTATGRHLSVGNSGSVGVGTESPASALHVVGGVTVASAEGSENNRLRLEYSAVSGVADISAVSTGGDTSMHFTTSSGGASTRRITVLPNGNTGIGTEIPKSRLDVITPPNSYTSVGATLSINQYSGIHFGYLEQPNTLYRKSAIVFERTDRDQNNAHGKVHILNVVGSGAASATLADARLTIDEDGHVGIDNVNPSYPLDVNGDVRAFGCFISGATTVGGSCTSDERFKTNVRPLEGSLGSLMQLRPVEFDWKTPEAGKDGDVGFIAQEVQGVKALSHLVDDSDPTHLRVTYGAELTVRLLAALQEQQRAIARLEKRVAELEGDAA